MFIVYDLIAVILLLAYLPRYVLGKKFHPGFSSRLGRLPKEAVFNSPIWIHAVSVGEALAVRGLVEGLRKAYPRKQFVFSTVTPTGNKIVRAIAKEGDQVVYLPLDLSWIVNRTLARINPALFIIAETEIWPNLITCLHSHNIPVAVVNGRISDRSFSGYSRIRFFVKPILERITVFCVQTERDSSRLSSLGVAEDKIRITGNMKFDIAMTVDEKNHQGPRKAILRMAAQEKLFVAGSTHPGEEESVCAAYKEMIKTLPELRLLIAPRHPERAQEVEKVIEKAGFTAARISALSTQNARHKTQDAKRIYILDTIGQLVSFYAAADIVFVGGSLIKKGGHNILEPAGLGKPVLFGPYMFNFRDIAELFLQQGAAILVRDEAGLAQQAVMLLRDGQKAAALSKAADRLIESNRGATGRNLDIIALLIQKLPV